MDDEIAKIIEEVMIDTPSVEAIKAALGERGYHPKDIDRVLRKYKHLTPHSHVHLKRNIRLFTTKEVFDRLGYGFATHQFINIIFYNTALAAGLGHAALFLVGLFNGLKNLLSINISSFVQEYGKVGQVSKKFMSAAGLVFGFSFLFMAFARKIASVELFALALLVGSIGVVAYGDLYHKLLKSHLKKERMGFFLAKISQFGVLITAASLLLSGWLLQTIPATGKTFSVFGYDLVAYGYLLSFEITAFAFIFSSYVLSRISQPTENTLYHFKDFLREHRHRVLSHMKVFVKNKVVFLLMVASVLSGVAQGLGNSYYGIFIYNEFGNVWLGGFLNVAVIFAFGVLGSLLGPWITKKLNKSIGLSPMLVFGTMLIAMMPFFAAWQPNLYSLGAASVLSIIGSAIVGVAQGLLAHKLLHEEERNHYFASLPSLITLPYIILLPLGAWLAQSFGLVTLFKVITGVLVLLVVPFYLVLVGFANKHKW